MITLKVQQFKEGFFDRKRVVNAVDKATFRIFKEWGRKTRSRAQKSLKYGDRPAPAGQPPTAHRSRTITRKSRKTGKTRRRSVSFLREFLYFVLDTESKSVVVGPARLNSTVDPKALPALEYGGMATILTHGKRKRVSIREHPFMRPAAAAETAGLPAQWRNSVR